MKEIEMEAKLVEIAFTHVTDAHAGWKLDVGRYMRVDFSLDEDEFVDLICWKSSMADEALEELELQMKEAQLVAADGDVKADLAAAILFAREWAAHRVDIDLLAELARAKYKTRWEDLEKALG